MGGSLDEEGAARRPVQPEVCVGAIVLVDDRILMVERGHAPAAGRWSIPGGRVEPGETLEAALRREVAEETGLTVEAGELLGWVERISQEHHFVILDFLADLADLADGDRRDPPAPTAGDDAAAARWVSLSEVGTLPLVDGLADFLIRHGIVLPGF